MKPEVLKSWSLEIEYFRAQCLGDDQKARGYWERDWSLGFWIFGIFFPVPFFFLSFSFCCYWACLRFKTFQESVIEAGNFYEKLSIGDAKWWRQKWKKGQSSSWPVTPGTGVNGLSNLFKVTLLKCLLRCFCPDNNTVYSVFLSLLINSNFW